MIAFDLAIKLLSIHVCFARHLVCPMFKGTQPTAYITFSSKACMLLTPLVPTAVSSPGQVLVGRLVDMGFPRPQVEQALMETGGDPDEAAERLMTQVGSNLKLAH